MTSWSTNINYAFMSKQCWHTASEDSDQGHWFIHFFLFANQGINFRLLNMYYEVQGSKSQRVFVVDTSKKESAFILTGLILNLQSATCKYSIQQLLLSVSLIRKRWFPIIEVWYNKVRTRSEAFIFISISHT